MDLVLTEKRLRIMPVILIGLAVVAALAAWYTHYRLNYRGDSPKIPASINGVVYKSPVQLHPFVLTDHNGGVFDISRFQNNWTFLVFGYTHCPDICPATLSQLVLLKKSLASGLNLKNQKVAIEPQFLFVSVDPDRDSSNHLSDYIDYFDRSFIAATGRLEQIEIIEKQLDVFHRFGRPNSSGEYSVNHSAEIFLIGPQGRAIATFAPPLNVPRTAQQFVEIIRFYMRLNGLTV